MELRQLGTTGMRVSELGLGTMTWGRDTDEIDAAEQFRDFLDAGGTLIDTSASYADGASEEVVGSLLTEVRREDVVICTKAGVRSTSRGNMLDASRGAVLGSLDASLQRLGTDHVDLFLVQNPDPRTPLEETLSALQRAVDSGRARYVGLSNHAAWQQARAATLLEQAGLELAAVEMEYSLLERGVEREVVPAALALGSGLVAWSPLGRGVLTGKYRRTIPADSRAASTHLSGFVQPYLDQESSAIVEAVAIAAEGLGRSVLEVSLAWLRARPGVSSALVGARTPGQLRTSLAALDLELPPEVGAALDEVSAPATGYPERR
ncbi:aryl-alcohol dehydrogenase-like predicted oxidoreductase [Flavimobilis soli]|uniref:Aryl-alcohol dehydrogenase-like predicted oxidoreductase n=1 Tax=Flavimobilis soli TaxID=442709 RepID=A0A2A9EC16_9MICO|nr:aldo/keto reductase [Flavimobilis soli]PFG35760.1 aryl-alcohol dehydrogenase-like predicted oxidoreductase [Flavimobilis soli]